MHGWRAWLDLAIGPNAERTQRWNRGNRVLQPASQGLRRNQRNREIVGDLARIDISAWLSVEGRRTRLANVAEPEVARPTVTEQVEALAGGLALGTWDRIAAELADPVAIGREFADHGWCDLLVGLVRGIEARQRLKGRHPAGSRRDVETRQDAVARDAEAWQQEARQVFEPRRDAEDLQDLEEWMRRAVTESSRAHHRPRVDKRVADIVVGHVWEAFEHGGYTWVERDLRPLRVLAVFMCPAPEAHAEVREHALRPAVGMLTDQTRDRLDQVIGLP